MNADRIDRIYALVTTVVVAIAVIAGFWILGTPARQRDLQADRERRRDLSQLARQLSAIRSDEEEVPDELPVALTGNDAIARDPITNELYDYRKLGPETYELCATFAASSDEAVKEINQFWTHAAGRHCFEMSVETPPPPVGS